MSTNPAKSVMVICDSNFHNLCQKPEDYVNRLVGVLKNRHGDDVKIITVTGKYGLTRVTDAIEAYPVEDRNKTLFVQTVENNVNYFDELLIVSLTTEDPFIEGVADNLYSHSKDIIRYSYTRRT